MTGISSMTWRKSSYSLSNGDCVEAADGGLVRDSKDPDGPVLAFGPASWREFTGRQKQGGQIPPG